MGLMDYLSITPAVASQANKRTGVPAPPSSVLEDKPISPALPTAHSVSEIRPVEQPDIDFNKLISEKGYFGAFQSLNKKPDFEAEEKRTRRSRELALLGDIANLGGQAIASAIGARRFAPIQSQIPQYNERLQRLRDAKRSYDMDYNNKSLSMIFKDYEQKRAGDVLKSQAAAKQAAADLQYKRDLTLKQIDQAFQAGMLSAKGKQALEAQAARAKSDQVLEGIKHKYRLGEIKTKENSANSKVVDSVMGDDGNVYTRSTKLTDNEAMQIVQSSGLNGGDLGAFTTGVEVDALGNPIPGTGKVDWRAAAAYAIQNGMIGADELIGRGFKPGSRRTDSSKGKGYGSEDKGKGY